MPVDLRAAAAQHARTEQERGKRRTYRNRVQSRPRQSRKSPENDQRRGAGVPLRRLDQTDRPLNPFTPFKASNPDAGKLYGAIVAQARLPVFYQALGVPDTLEGRFLVLSLHLFAVHRRLKAEGEPARELAQDLADRFTADMETVLRELGVGDLSVPWKVRKIAAAHAGLVEELERACGAGDEAVAASLANALPPDQRDSGPLSLQLAHYVRDSVEALGTQSVAALAAGEVKFPEIGAGGGSND
ncbi:MAG TPA: ubiquinol-cytochrome C chaperone family protein [Methyloceanibacter sp.]|nr:ubiquinol-cytochrome C chaperone family protein [Methyloceanibacter sp.]